MAHFLFPERASKRKLRMLENDDPLNEFVVFSRPQGLQNEIQIDPEMINESSGEREGRRAEKRALLEVKVAYPRYSMRFRGGPGAEG